MVLLIAGASHTGKTLLAQRLLETYKYPSFSIDHLKMGLIRSKHTLLTPNDDVALTDLLWPIVREMIKTVIENNQNLIVEGCYIPPDWRRNFNAPNARYLPNIKFVCLAMSERFIKNHFDEILSHENVIESRLVSESLSVDDLIADNNFFIDSFRKAGEKIALIDDDYENSLTTIVNEIMQDKQG